jgi:2',3'-cyclic-nucleotide 2'-phosphodiesterase (5'-nucleotidase family)
LKTWIRSALQRLIIAGLSLAAVGFAAPARAQTMILEFSDSHSAYDRLPEFLHTFQEMREEYLRREPKGQVVVIVNGDYAGLSQWSTENGWIGIKALELMARVAPVLYVLGNHDAFDWSSPKDGNKLAAAQLKRLHQVGVKILGANVEFDSTTKDLISDHVDFKNSAGKTLRFAGLGLEAFFLKSNWEKDPKHPIVLQMTRSLPVMREVLKRASTDGVDGLVFFQHDGHQDVGERLRALRLEQKQSGAAINAVKIPLMFAAHDHELVHKVVEGVEVIDSRSNFDFTVAELDAKLDVKSTIFMDSEAQAKISKQRLARTPTIAADKATSSIDRFIGMVQKFVEKLRVKSREVVTETGGFDDYKLSLKNGPKPLGTALAESLRAWGQDESRKLGLGDIPVMALYNSSSYRVDTPVPSGPLTRGDIKSFYPFVGEVLMFQATAADVQRLFQDLRLWRIRDDGKYTPQISANLKEAKDYLLVDVRTGYPLLQNPQQKIILVLDSWLSGNRYDISSFREFLATHPPLAGFSHQKVLENYAAQVMPQFSPKPVRSAGRCMQVHAR